MHKSADPGLHLIIGKCDRKHVRRNKFYSGIQRGRTTPSSACRLFRNSRHGPTTLHINNKHVIKTTAGRPSCHGRHVWKHSTTSLQCQRSSRHCDATCRARGAHKRDESLRVHAATLRESNGPARDSSKTDRARRKSGRRKPVWPNGSRRGAHRTPFRRRQFAHLARREQRQ